MAELTVKDVAIALYKGNIQERFGRSVEDGNQLIRNAILEVAGCKEKWDYHVFNHNKHLVFKILSEILEETVGQAIIEKYEAWVDLRNVAFGDTIEFKVQNNDLFEVGIVADGVDNIRRQRILHGKLAMNSFQLGVKIYEEFDMFRLGKIDWADMVARVAKSVDNAIMRLIVKQIENAYCGVANGKYHYQGTYEDAKVLDIIENVEAKTGKKAVIYGCKSALANLRKSSAAHWAEADKMDVRNQGYVGMFEGTQCIELPNFMDKEENLVLSKNHLFIIPEGSKIIKLLVEGGADVYESTEQHARADQQIEMSFVQRYQLGVIKSNVYGVVEIA